MTDARRTCPHCDSPLEAGESAGHWLCPNCQTTLCPSDGVALDAPHDPLIGLTLGDFEILEQLGRGGMGAVYKAREASLDRLVALKVLPAGLASDSNFVVRFEREARAAAAVRHRSIVQIHGVGQAEGHRYIAMEYIDGESLADVLTRDGALPQDQALAIMRPVLSAVAAAHEAGIVHRDIKPANIMFDARADVRVTDFGLAKRTEGDVAVTDVGQSLGTPLYMAPEAATGGEATARSDLYSLGGTFYTLLAGRPPFEGKTAGELILKHASEAPPPLAELAPNVDPRLCQIIDRLLRKDPEERYPSALAVLAEIDALGALTTPGDAVRAEGRALIGDAPTLVMTEGQRLGLEAATQGQGRRHAGRRRQAGYIASVSILAVAAAVWTILGLAGKSRQPEAKPPKPSVVFEGKRDEVTALDRDAEAAFEHAKNAASMRRWSVVVEAIDRIKKEYGRTGFFDANRTDIAALRAQAAARLAALPPDDLPDDPPAPLAEGWVSLFDGKTLKGWRVVEERDYAGHGKVRVEEGRIILARGQPRTGIVWTGAFPKANYEVALEARLEEGPELTEIAFPVGNSQCSLMVGGAQGTLVGLSYVDGGTCADNGTGTPIALQPGRWYRVRLRVTEARIEAWLDDQPRVNMARAGRKVSLAHWMEPVGPFGIACALSTAGVRAIRMRRLEPEAPPPEPAGEWVSLFDGKTLDGWRVPDQAFFRNHGDVAVAGGRIALEAGRPCTGVVATRSVPVADYEFSVEAMRVGGDAGFCNILFPVGTSHCTLLVGGRAVGLQTVDGREANDNPTTRQMKCQNGRWYRVRLRVTEERIEAWVDNEQVVNIPRAGHEFGLLGGYEPLLPMGVFSWESTSALRDMRLRHLKQEPPPAQPPGKPGE